MADQQFIVVHFRSEKLSFRQTRLPRFMPNCVFVGIQMRDKILIKFCDSVCYTYCIDMYIIILCQ